jgi:predicted metal-dependent hydrolase
MRGEGTRQDPTGRGAAREATPPAVEVRRSARRQRTVSAFREGGRTVVLVPAGLPPAEEARWVDQMVERLERRDRRRASDAGLAARARVLSARHLGGLAVPASVRWVGNQSTRWGSCTVSDRTIRLSDRLQSMPDWVIDYVLLHELAHLVHADHGPGFWSLLSAYPHTERARGFLDGVAFARLGARDDGPEAPPRHSVDGRPPGDDGTLF